VRDGFHLYNRHIVIRFYDDVLAQEYAEYQEYVEHLNRLHAMRQKMVKVAHGDNTDLDELMTNPEVERFEHFD